MGTEATEKTIGKEEPLNERQLKILRAAIRYFEEEIAPHGAAAIDDYLPGEGVTPDEVRSLRAELNRAQVRYVAEDVISEEPEAGSVAVLVIPHEPN